MKKQGGENYFIVCEKCLCLFLKIISHWNYIGIKKLFLEIEPYIPCDQCDDILSDDHMEHYSPRDPGNCQCWVCGENKAYISAFAFIAEIDTGQERTIETNSMQLEYLSIDSITPKDFFVLMRENYDHFKEMI